MSLIRKRDSYYDNQIECEKRSLNNWVTFLAAFIIRPILKVFFRFEVRGKENIPAKGEDAVVFAINHVSYMDPIIMLVSAYPRTYRFLARASLFKPLLGGLLARGGAIPIEPESADRKAVKRAAAALKRGECVGIFPEGTRMNSPEKEYKPHAGTVLIAQMGKAKIVPVGITGTDRIMPKDKKGIHFPKIIMTYGKPIDLNDYKDADKATRTQTILDDTMNAIFELRDSAR